jgi:protocatechuate 3,4-dioxygenase beta subunit
LIPSCTSKRERSKSSASNEISIDGGQNLHEMLGEHRAIGLKITGRVIDNSNGEPIPKAKIVILRGTMATESDSNGYYSITNIPPGVYDIEARMLGYKVNTKKIKGGGPQTRFVVNFELIRDFIE